MTVNDDDDFGFSAVSEEELQRIEKQLQQQLQAQELTTREKLVHIRNLMMPLLNNLKKNSDKQYIYWPNRQEKIDAFIAKIDSYIQNNS